MSGRQEREKRRAERVRAAEEQASEERRRRMMQLASAVAFLVIVAVAVAIVINQSQTSGGDTKLEDVALVEKQLEGIAQRETTLGKPDAKVKLIEFGDLQCSVCKEFAESILPPLIASKLRTGQAQLEFRNFTIIDEDSVPAGAAALAAGKQGRGWSFIELFYRNQGIEHTHYVDDAFLTALARDAGVKDIARWNEERRSKPVLSLVKKTTAEAESLGFTGTPSFAIEGPNANGLELLGTPDSAEALEKAIEEAR